MGCASSKVKDPEKQRKKQLKKLEAQRKKEEKKEAKRNKKKSKGNKKYKVAFVGTEHVAAPPLPPPPPPTAQAAATTTTMHNVLRVETPKAEPKPDQKNDLVSGENAVGSSASLSKTNSVVSSQKGDPKSIPAPSDPSSHNSRKHHKKGHDKKKKKKKHGHNKTEDTETEEDSSDTSSEASASKKAKAKEVNFAPPSATAAAGSPADRRDRSVSIEVEEVQELPARRTPVLVNSTSQTEDPTPSPTQWTQRTPVREPPGAAASPSGTARAASSATRRSTVPVPPELAGLDYQRPETLFTPLRENRGGAEDHTPFGGAAGGDAYYYPSYVNDVYPRASYTPYHQNDQTLPGSPYFYPNERALPREEPVLYYPSQEVAVYENTSPFGRTDVDAYRPYSPLYSSPPAPALVASEPRTFFYSLPSQLPNENYYENVSAQPAAAAVSYTAGASVPSMTYFAAAGRDDGPRYAAPLVEQEVVWPPSPSPAPPARAQCQVDVEEEEDLFPCVYGRVYARSPPGPNAAPQPLDAMPQRQCVVESREEGPAFATRETYFQTYEARPKDDSMWSSREGDRGHSRGYLSDMW